MPKMMTTRHSNETSNGRIYTFLDFRFEI